MPQEHFLFPFVRVEGIEWNTFEKTVLQWSRVFAMVDATRGRAQLPQQNKGLYSE